MPVYHASEWKKVGAGHLDIRNSIENSTFVPLEIPFNADGSPMIGLHATERHCPGTSE